MILHPMLCSDIKDQFIRKNFVAWDGLTIILQHELYCVSNIYNQLDCHRFDLHFAVLS